MKEKLVQAALEAGARRAAPVSGGEIVYSESFRDICRSNQCGNYGACWMCPPEIGPIAELMARARSYPLGVLYQTVGQLEDSFDIEGMFADAADHAAVSQRLQKQAQAVLKAPFLHLTCGGCHVCKTCAKVTDEPCRFPEKAMSSVEGYCMDVYNTTRSTPLRYTNGSNTVTYFGMVLFEE